ncbi:hypothetical protein F5148DRAFT_1355899 [Russula earlei]|uniref:Uncharacterized protein n=1 Tax=Russula earlei TaxID=71964 RepID=A0ACC0TRT4_9AGAM|nr:hypothetical protein F5148DRAFT_1355899 [Russula earlei]
MTLGTFETPEGRNDWVFAQLPSKIRATTNSVCQFRPTARRSECLAHLLAVHTATWFVRTATWLVRWGIVAAATSAAFAWLLGAGDGGSGVVPGLIAMVSDVLSGREQDASAIASGGDGTFRSKNFLRLRLVHSLHGSAAGSTERPIAPVPREVPACQESDQLPTEGFNGAGGLNSVVEEDLEDWVDDFEAISHSEVPSESKESAEQAQARPCMTSKTSRRSRKSLRRDKELRLILNFPLPLTFIPSPTKSRTPSSALPPPEVTPIHDDRSEAVEEEASLNIPAASAPRVDSSVSFYTAHSRSSSLAAPSNHLDQSSSSHSSLQQQQQPPLSPLHLPFPSPSSLSPPLSLTGSPSTTRLSIRTLTRASATLKRFGNLTRETFRTS